MKSFKFFLKEGGNVKVGPKGQETSAAPFPVNEKDRSVRRADVHGALSDIHDAFHKEHGEHLFGKDKEHLHSSSVYSGSSEHFMGHHVSDVEFVRHKPSVGDVDVQVSHDHKNKLEKTLATGKKFGKYTVAGTKKHGNEISAVMRHENGEHHQFDFEGTHHPGSETDKFLHSANWEDTKSGIKGVHHKVLINAVGGESHKFSNTHGLRSRTDEKDVGVSHPTEVSKVLFGKSADHNKIKSFKGVVDLIKKHKSPTEHQAIYDKFKKDVSSKKDTDHTAALAHMKSHLNVKDDVSEMFSEEVTHHASIVPMMGVAPHSHMGHAKDIGGKLASLPGTKHVGLSGKADVFSAEERKNIMKRQWKQKDTNFHVVKSAGETIHHAYHSLPLDGRKELHLLVGSDRRDMAEKLKDGLNSGKIKEMGDKKWDAIHIHTPDDLDRTHGMSGTKMRQSIANGDHAEFKRHLGNMFSDKESKSIMDRSKEALQSGKIKVKR
jgi:hypothetical protein